MHHYTVGAEQPAWVIGAGPSAVDSEALRRGFERGASLHELLTRVLEVYNSREVPRRDRAARRLAAAAEVTAYLRAHPVVPATAARGRAPSATSPFPRGGAVHPLVLADRYLAAVAAVTGVWPSLDTVPDLRVLAAFAGVTLEPVVAHLEQLAT